MPPKESTSTDNTAFLLSCLVNVEKLPWAEIAAMNGITGSTAVPAGPSAQRKFKRLVDASAKFKLEGGKVVLKNPLPPAAEDDDVDDAVSAEDTPATKPAKKRGRPPASTKAAIKAKKAKIEKKEKSPEADTSIADDEENAE